MENIESMKKDHFKMVYDRSTESWVVVKSTDELTKNHRDIGEQISGVMPEKKNDPLCPVQSYSIYIDHLNPENEYLWQLSLKNVDMMNDGIWYGKQKIGKNKLANFMTDISTKCDLSRMYTNHCIRVTGISILTRMRFSASEIMSVSGHKSVQSLAIYQKTDDKKKREMGDVLAQAMSTNDENIQRKKFRSLPPVPEKLALPPPENSAQHQGIEARNRQIFDNNQAAANAPNVEASIIPFDPNLDKSSDQQVPSFDLLDLINSVMSDEEKSPENAVQTQGSSNSISSSSTTNNINVPRSMFSNCNIGNVIFKIDK